MAEGGPERGAEGGANFKNVVQIVVIFCFIYFILSLNFISYRSPHLSRRKRTKINTSTSVAISKISLTAFTLV